MSVNNNRTVENIVTLLCFTALAIVFHHWWISLFAIIRWVANDSAGEDRPKDK